MIRTTLLSTLLVAVLSPFAAADILVVNGIPSFDTNLGTLNSATVIIDPIPQQTSVHDVNPFTNLGNHAHFINPFPVQVPGLGTFPFASTQTSFENPGLGDSHSHLINLLPSQQTFSGNDLAWFLNPANGVNTVNILAPPSSMSEDHNHTVNFLPAIPQTIFNFTPVPEPASALLMLLAVAGLAAGRKR